MAGSRHRQREGGDATDVESIEAKLLSTLLELTVVVAQTGTKVVPPLEAPPLLRPFLQFTAKVPAAAFRAARRVLDEDPLFRARVATVATDELVGRAGSLYVRRPDGWEEDFTNAVIDAMGDASNEGAAKRAGKLEKKLAGMETALARAEAELARVRVELVSTQTQLMEERRIRASLATEVADLRDAIVAHEQSKQSAATNATEAKSSVARLTKELAEARARAEAAEEFVARRTSFDTAVSEALSAFDRFGSELRSFHVFHRDGAGSATPGTNGGERLRAAESGRGSTPPAAGRPNGKGSTGAGTSSGARKPMLLPPGVFDDTTEAASALFRTPEVMVLVDAYNVAKWRWPTAGIADLRDRLVAMAGQISQRTGATIHLVFDGAHTGSTVKPGGSARVRLVYTEAGVEADDVVLSMAKKAPPTLPIVVVSNDMRVVDGALRLGVNVVPNHAFAGVAGSS